MFDVMFRRVGGVARHFFWRPVAFAPCVRQMLFRGACVPPSCGAFPVFLVTNAASGVERTSCSKRRGSASHRAVDLCQSSGRELVTSSVSVSLVTTFNALRTSRGRNRCSEILATDAAQVRRLEAAIAVLGEEDGEALEPFKHVCDVPSRCPILLGRSYAHLVLCSSASRFYSYQQTPNV